ncbi:MAG: hypothetical protein E4G90_02425 [Gemmatimonadales bacterium]|jgi:nicotinic acid phosphoribosyltransferase|nr:MAG: hypothetical protein E4G90_02425 [Gemmatimonadales bacterium]
MDVLDPEQMHREHQAWRAFVREFQKLNPKIDFDSVDMLPFVDSVKLWGEELHALRSMDPATARKALEEAREAYDPQIIIQKTEDGGAFGGGKTSG